MCKGYFGKPVLEDVSFVVPTSAVCGLIGYNGVGKTTLLRVIAGVYRPESGCVLLDGEPVYENAAKKAEVFMLTEDLLFPTGATLASMRDFYAGYLPRWSDVLFERLLAAFGLVRTQKIEGFSKGMRRQAGLAFAFASRATYLLLDEIFDGLDLVMRRVTSRLLADCVRTSGATVIVTSHNLRELEDGVDELAMIRQNRLVFSGPVAEIRTKHGTLEEYFLEEREVDEAAFAGVFDL